MCQFSDIKSHPDLPLEKHLAQVAEIALELLEGKRVEFPSLGLTKIYLKALIERAALFHDLGKATTYFQDRLATGKKGPNGEHQHAGLSTILAYEPISNYCKENNLSEVIALAPLLAILFHHSELSKRLPNDLVMEARLRALRIPTQSGHPFRRKPATDSDPIWPPIPIHSGHFLTITDAG